MKQYFSFQWHITDECDQRCKHCYIFSEDTCKHLDSMTWEQMRDTFYNCLDFCQVYDRLPYFYITGGDPILHPDFWKLLALMKEHSVPFTILGNPFHLTDEVCHRLKDFGCEKYQLSLDGMRETHDWFRKPGSFDITLEKIGCINRAGIRSVIMTTVSGTNIDQVPDIIDAVVQAGVNVFAFARYCPTSEEKDVGITPQRYRQLLADCDKKFKAYEAVGCQTYFNKKDHLWTLYEYETGAFKIPEEIINELTALEVTHKLTTEQLEQVRKLKESLNAPTFEDSKEEKPDSVVKFEEEYARRQHEINMGRMKEDEDYYKWLESAAKTAFEGLADYEDDLWKYQEEVYKGRKTSFW